MTASTLYHTYNALSKAYADFMLRIDLIGIGIMIFTLTVVSVYTGYHAWTKVRDDVCITMITLFLFNFIL